MNRNRPYYRQASRTGRLQQFRASQRKGASKKTHASANPQDHEWARLSALFEQHWSIAYGTGLPPP